MKQVHLMKNEGENSSLLKVWHHVPSDVTEAVGGPWEFDKISAPS